MTRGANGGAMSRTWRGLLAAVLVSSAALPAWARQDYDVVITGGRVMDPESGLDGVRNVGISGGTIQAVGTQAMSGSLTIDARGLVVAPGFIDLHEHAQSDEGYRLQAQDGVTTSLELEIGTEDVDGWYRDRAAGAVVNYGVSVGHPRVRMAVMHDPGTFLPRADAAHRAATANEIAEMTRRIEEGLARGAVAVGMGRAYTPEASHWEILEIMRVAGRFGAPVHVHIGGGPDRAGALSEVIAAATIGGASLHVVHVNSSGGPETPRLLRLIGEARARGLDVTTECYPYTAGMTEIESALFDDWPTWEESRFGTFQWVATGERLDRASFERYRAVGGTVIIHSNTEEMVAVAVNSPLTMIASDGFLEAGRGHPRTSGTYARVLGRYVREQGSLTLMAALRKMTIMPARRLEGWVPLMNNKGRIREGADADITVFDADRVIDRATYTDPTQPSAGIRHVLVNGVAVVENGRLREGLRPGRAVRAPVR